ncbi:MAG: ABC transporter substrate-binding protein [bacterium]|nr:ABC transporter substrate-binding protein [bacterium]
MKIQMMVKSMEKRIFTRGCIFSFFILLTLIFPFQAVSAEVAVFLSGDMEAYQSALAGVRKSVQGADLTEFNMKDNLETGKNLVITIRDKKPKAILALGARAAKLAREEITDIPVIYCLVFNPFELGLEAANISGVAMIASPDSQFENFKAVLPSLKRLGVLYDPGKSSRWVEGAKKAAPRYGIELVERRINSAEGVSQALKEIISTIDALWLLPDTTVVSKEIFSYLLNVTLDKQLPIFAFSEGLVKSGALLALSPDYRETGAKAGELINAILNGNSDHSSLVYPAGKLYINSKTAEAVGIKIPGAVKQKAQAIY